MKKDHPHTDDSKVNTPEENTQSTEDVTPTEAVKELSFEQKIAQCEQQIAEWKGKYAYLYADFDNYRKRVAKDMQSARNDSLIKALEPTINVLDHFRLAVKSSNETDNLQKIREGLDLIFDQLRKVVADLGIEAIEAEGGVFDPNIHDAISQQPSDLPEGTILQQWNCGYKMGDRLIRPARVVVSAGKTIE